MLTKFKLTSALLTLWEHEGVKTKRDQELIYHLEVVINVVDKARACRLHTIPSYKD